LGGGVNHNPGFIVPLPKDHIFWRGVRNEIPLSEDNIENVFEVSDEVLQFHETFFFFSENCETVTIFEF